MLRSKALIFGIISAILLTHSLPVFSAEAIESTRTRIPPSLESSDEVLGYYEKDGGETVIPIKEKAGIAERLPAGTTLEAVLNNNPMSPESEAKLVHKEPEVPFIMAGVMYQPEQIHLFDGHRLGFTVGEDGLLYAFTSYDSMRDFLSERSVSTSLKVDSEYSIFYEYTNFCWQYYRLVVLPNTTLHSLSYMDDDISSMEISPHATYGCTLFEYENLQGDYFDVTCGSEWPDLGDYGWNDRASSLGVWP